MGVVAIAVEVRTRDVGINACFLAGFAGFASYVIFLGVLTGRNRSLYGDSIASIVGGGVIAGVFMLIATSRISVRRDEIVLFNLLSCTMIPARDIQEFITENGLQIRLRSGRTFGCLAYGSSVLAMMTGNLRAKRFARRAAAVMPTLDPSDDWRQDEAKTYVRIYGLIGAASVAALPSAIALVVHGCSA